MSGCQTCGGFRYVDRNRAKDPCPDCALLGVDIVTELELDRQASTLGVTRAALIRRILAQWVDDATEPPG